MPFSPQAVDRSAAIPVISWASRRGERGAAARELCLGAYGRRRRASVREGKVGESAGDEEGIGKGGD